MLLLRGPQTLNELVTRTERMARFAAPDDARHALERMVEREPPLVLRLPKAPGQREERWAHLLCGPVDVAALAAAAPARERGGERDDALEARIAALEARIEALERALGTGPTS